MHRPGQHTHILTTIGISNCHPYLPDCLDRISSGSQGQTMSLRAMGHSQRPEGVALDPPIRAALLHHTFRSWPQSERKETNGCSHNGTTPQHLPALPIYPIFLPFSLLSKMNIRCVHMCPPGCGHPARFTPSRHSSRPSRVGHLVRDARSRPDAV